MVRACHAKVAQRGSDIPAPYRKDITFQAGSAANDPTSACRAGTAALDRLLDPENQSVTLATLQKAAVAIGREVRLELV